MQQVFLGAQERSLSSDDRCKPLSLHPAGQQPLQPLALLLACLTPSKKSAVICTQYNVVL